MGGHIDLIGDVSLIHTPMKEIEKDANAILSSYDP
jgi:hypothetical protein